MIIQRRQSIRQLHTFCPKNVPSTAMAKFILRKKLSVLANLGKRKEFVLKKLQGAIIRVPEVSQYYGHFPQSIQNRIINNMFGREHDGLVG